MSQKDIDNDLDRLARAVFAAQPFTRLLGAELISMDGGNVEVRLRIRPELQQQHGFVHGGVISYLADNAVTFAGGIALGGDAVTAHCTVNFSRPASGEYLIARARAVSATRNQAICHSTVYSVDGETERIVAVAQGTVVAAHTP
ncbi:Phenylacetic acid degradation protein PaaD [Rhodococcus sp. AW25M09]|uniref:PaaI family thioesterase n=1 Tax=Rhodococcus sp. AW25M09 TaxID=1268303 RepID=UPI0002ABBA77|nr:PaaI family thioesterase [Rhodococcus sp. AW25M09]CCQ16490.1 Phenylacetic acid degradation protein PaaD [Rhodococcus sp. AW25M09]